MSLTRRGDNTYSNYAEANRAFWRQTVLPLVARTANALARWLSPAWGSEISLRADLDQVEALSPEREALWARVEKASFLTDNEKRAAVGYGGKLDDAGAKLATKFRPDQPRDDRGRWVEDGRSDDGAGENDEPDDGPDEEPEEDDPEQGDGLLHLVARRGPNSNASPVQQMRLANARRDAQDAMRRVRELEPNWREPRTIGEGIQGQIGHHEAVAAAARARLAELTRDALPNSNPSWGVNRLRKELHDRGFFYDRPANDGPGYIYRNPQTREELRLMERRPGPQPRTTEPPKWFQDFYYRYRGRDYLDWGKAIPVPNKP